MDIIFELAENITKTEYSDLPDQAVEVTKKFILDAIGNTIAGSTALGSSQIVNQVKSLGGSEESTILTYGGKVPSIHATFVNSYMAFARDFGDTHDGVKGGRSGTHCNDTVLPPALAISEQVKEKSGKELITAVALGVDLAARLGMSADFFRGWHNTSIFGGFGATASSGKILGLDKGQLVNAFGIAYGQTHGNRQGRKDGALSRRLQVAFSSKAGAYSALLAKAGFTGAQNILGGEWGLYRLYRDPDTPFDYEEAKETLTDELGKRFEIINLAAKQYPCCGATHAPIDAVLEVMARDKITADDIEEVVVYISESKYESLGAPFKIRDNPQVDAQFSIPYTIAVALLKGGVKIKDFEVEEITGNKEVLRMAEKVRAEVDKSIPKKARVPIRVEIHTKSGKEYINKVNVIKGDPEKPMTFEEFAKKFRGCAEYSAKPMPPQKIEAVIQIISELDKLKDIKELIIQLT